MVSGNEAEGAAEGVAEAAGGVAETAGPMLVSVSSAHPATRVIVATAATASALWNRARPPPPMCRSPLRSELSTERTLGHPYLTFKSAGEFSVSSIRPWTAARSVQSHHFSSSSD